MPTITYTGINQVVTCENTNTSLLDISTKHKIPHVSECGGTGNCTTCRVRVTNGQQNLSKPTPQERRMAHQRRWDPSIRLACQCIAQGDVEIQRLIWTNSEVSQLQLELAPQSKAEEREIAILCCDLRNFTGITSSNLNYDMAHLLNRFYTALGEPIMNNNGIIYQYVGDEIMGVFGLTGGTQESNCRDALRAALGMQAAIEKLNVLELREFGTQFKIGIGITYGKAYMGYLGHPRHRQFAIIGDAINTANRVQELTKETKTKILIAHSVYFNRQSLKIGQWFKRKLRGKDNTDFIYEFIGFAEPDLHFELQHSLDVLFEREADLAKSFYQKLFEREPALRSLFKGDMAAQAKVLNHMLVGIVYSLSRPEYLSMNLAKLGRSHVQYGVQPHHYQIVLDVLLATLEELLGDQFTESTAHAWRTALLLVAEKMQPNPIMEETS